MRKILIGSIVFASAAFGSSGATAQTIGNTPQVLELTDGSGFFGDAFAEGNEGASFSDRFTFTVGGPTGMDFDAIVSSASRTATSGLDLSGLSLYRSGAGGADLLVDTGRSRQTGAVDVWSLSSANLGTGDYYVLVSGDMLSASSAAFGGAAMLVPVPEPETYGMMLAGLGALGFLARRRMPPRQPAA